MEGGLRCSTIKGAWKSQKGCWAIPAPCLVRHHNLFLDYYICFLLFLISSCFPHQCRTTAGPLTVHSLLFTFHDLAIKDRPPPPQRAWEWHGRAMVEPGDRMFFFHRLFVKPDLICDLIIYLSYISSENVGILHKDGEKASLPFDYTVSKGFMNITCLPMLARTGRTGISTPVLKFQLRSRYKYK